MFEKCGEELFVVDLHGRGIDGVVCRELVPDDHDLVAVMMMKRGEVKNEVLETTGRGRRGFFARCKGNIRRPVFCE